MCPCPQPPPAAEKNTFWQAISWHTICTTCTSWVSTLWQRIETAAGQMQEGVRSIFSSPVSGSCIYVYFNAVSWTEDAALNSWPLCVFTCCVVLTEAHFMRHNMSNITPGAVTLNHNAWAPDSHVEIQPGACSKEPVHSVIWFCRADPFTWVNAPDLRFYSANVSRWLSKPAS